MSFIPGGSSPAASDPNLFFGQAPLAIGPVQFYSQESPQQLNIGLEQKLVVHDLIGGTRVIQCLGSFGKDVLWEGKWRGTASYIQQRDAALRQLAATGQVTTLVWQSYVFDVIVSEYECNFKHSFRGDYKITVKVLRDNTRSGPGPQTGIDPTVVSLYNAAQTNLNVGLPSITAQQTSFLSKITSDFAALGRALSIAGPLATAVATGGAANALSVLASLIPNIQQYYGLLTGVSEAQIVAVQSLLASVVLIQKNLQAGQAVNTVVVFGGSLFSIAAKYFGDPSFALQIAQAQNPPLLTMRLPPGQPTTLVLPPLASTTRS